MIAQTGSLTEASQLLNISQPALSKAVKLLEHELGVKLLAPLGRGIIVTDEGRRIAERANGIIGDLERLREIGSATDASQRKLSIASFEVFTTYFLGSVLAENPNGLVADIYELTPGDMEEAVASGMADIGITYLPIPHRDLELIEMTKIKMGIYCGAATKFDKFEFEDLPFVIPIRPIKGTPTKIQGLDGWPDSSIPRKVVFRVGMMESALELCRRGVAVAYLPQFVVQIHNENVKSQRALKEIAPPKNLKQKPQSVYLIKRKSMVETKALRLIAKALRTIK
jgi:DNA-binding transcriptional LysR family regulator